MPRVRFTLRRLMMIVATVAILIWAERMLRIRSERLAIAAYFADQEAMWRAEADKAAGPPGGFDFAGWDLEWAERYAELRRDYEGAASRPWTPVEPPPPMLMPPR